MDSLKTITVLFRAQASLSKLIASDVKQYQLSVTEFGVLEALYHKGPQTIQSLVDKVLIANSSMSYVLNQLEKKNWIRRESHQIDRRSRTISLSEEGHAVISRIYPKHVLTLRERLNRLSPSEETQLQSALKKIGIE